MRDIKMCHPELQEKAKKLISACKSRGLLIGISECFRTVEEQNVLYAKGRTAAGKIVTNAKGDSYSSHHQWGTAFDFYRNDGKGAYNDNDGFFSKVGEIGKQLGLEWGGDWVSPVDKPHFQLPQWGSTTAKLKQLYKTPENFKKTWKGVNTVDNLKEKVYNYTLEIPEWARGTVQKLLDKGYLKGNDKGELELTYQMLRLLGINDRAGLYDK
jgi:peptidoglycan L-alanyl-D-glutamate endopeptidase CwlK